MSSVNKRTLLLVVWLAVLGGLFFLVTHLNVSSGSTPTPPPFTPKMSAPELERQWPQIVVHAAAPPRGALGATYTLAEFGDFQCPQCAKMRPVLERLVAQSGGQANLIFCQRPFPQEHPYAVAAAQASLAAAAQGKFWPMYDILYANQDDLEPGYYTDYAQQAGLNAAQFEAAMTNKQYQSAVQADATFADSLGVQVTPTLLLHNNKTGLVVIYVGADSHAPGAPVGFQGILQLAAAPPWAAAH